MLRSHGIDEQACELIAEPLEEALYKQFDNFRAYSTQAQALIASLKKNGTLANKLCNQELTIDDVAKMSASDLMQYKDTAPIVDNGVPIFTEAPPVDLSNKSVM